MDIINWEKFKTLNYNILVKNHNQYLFRGQANSNWKLISSLYRIVEEYDVLNNIVNLDFLNIYVNNIISEVHNILVSKWEFEPYNLSDIYQFNSFLAKLQHYGFPTPLLDWSYNPYIAVFFAINDESNIGNYFSIYIFDYIAWIRKYYQPINLLNETKFISTFLPNNFGNERAKLQQSVFTISNVYDIEFELLNISKNNNYQYLIKYNFSKDEIPKIKKDLENMGIIKSKIFPNLEEICKNLAFQFFNKR